MDIKMNIFFFIDQYNYLFINKFNLFAKIILFLIKILLNILFSLYKFIFKLYFLLLKRNDV